MSSSERSGAQTQTKLGDANVENLESREFVQVRCAMVENVCGEVWLRSVMLGLCRVGAA